MKVNLYDWLVIWIYRSNDGGEAIIADKLIVGYNLMKNLLITNLAFKLSMIINKYYWLFYNMFYCWAIYGDIM